MAGRPVTVHSGQSLKIWVIVFAALTVIALGLFIFQLTNNKALQNRARQAENRLTTYGSPPPFYAEEAQARGSNVFAAMETDRRKLASLTTGNPEDVAVGIVPVFERLLGEIAQRKPGTLNPGDTLRTAIERLDEAHTTAQQRAAELDRQLADAQANLANCTADLKVKEDQFTAQVTALGEQLRQAQDEKTSALAQKDEQLTQAQGEIETQKQQILRMDREGLNVVRDKDVEIGRLETQIAALQKQLQSLKPSTFDPHAILTKADGRIVRAVPGSDVVYINLGAADKVKVGMGFEVYSQTREAPKGLRGKASLEVATVLEDTAECRVLRRENGQPIIEGDSVVNIAFERGRQPKFVVQGEFDLNYDGVPDFDGLEQVTALIRQWGGQVVKELDESVDFVVIGQAPTGARFDDQTMVSEVVREQARRREGAGQQFNQLLERAATMYIPIITQNQFLYLTGYAGDTTMVRR